jgi:Zn-finger nucleic acid-binding protein
MMYGLSNHACPRCREPLYIGHASGVTLHGCGRCGGVWLGSACARRIAEVLPGDAIELAGRVSRNAKGEITTLAPVACPICSAPMTRTRAAAAGVDLDVCGAHGTWYDRHELEQIAVALEHSTWRGGPNPRRRALQAAKAAAGTVAGAAIAAGAVAQAAQGSQGARAQESVAGGVIDVAEVGAEVVLDGTAETVIEGAGAAVEAGGTVLEGAFDVIGGILGMIFD